MCNRSPRYDFPVLLKKSYEGLFPAYRNQSVDLLWFLYDGNIGRPKLCGNCAFPQNFHTRKLGEITVFIAVNLDFYYLA